jgi:hypothetical protein
MSYGSLCLGNLEYNSIPENRIEEPTEMGRRLSSKELEEMIFLLVLETRGSRLRQYGGQERLV